MKCESGADEMLNMEGISAEAKIGKILILVSLILGILVLLCIGVLAAIMYTAGRFIALDISLTIPLLILVPIFLVKVIGLLIGFLALNSTERGDFSRAGIFAIISCVLPPLDIVMLIGGIFCLVSREGNETRVAGESRQKSGPE